MSSSNSVRLAVVPEVAYGVTPSVKASLIVQDLTYLADAIGESGNLISIAYLDTGTAGAEVVTVVGNAISVSMEDGVSTATQIKTAIDASVAASALISVSVSGTAGDAQVAAALDLLEGGVGDFFTARFTSEGLSGTPDTVESAQIRTDRMGSGQIVTGLQVGGDMAFELAKEASIDELLESAMYNTWTSLGLKTVDLTIDATAKTIARASGSFVTDELDIGDFINLLGFANAANNVQVMVTSVAALTIGYAGTTLVDAVGSGTTYQRLDKLTIGTTKKSFTIEKTFTDLTNKAIVYRGMIVNALSVNFAFGELATGSFGFSGNDYETVDAAADFATYLKTITAPATTQTLNGSVDMPFLASSAVGALATSGFDLQSVGLSLNNNLNPQNVIGDIAPTNYSAGTAQITMDLSAYLTDEAWALLAKKLSQEAFTIAFQVKNADGHYCFYIPKIQVSFDDPTSGGQNQDILLSMTGTAKVDTDGGSALVIYRSL